MGLYTTLFKDAACERCGEVYKRDYQFKTGQDALGEYKDGDLVPDDYPKKAVYEASYYTLCGFCWRFSSYRESGR